MSQNSRHASRHEYNKPQLKAQIEEAMARFLEGGHAVQHVPAAMPAAPPMPSPDAAAVPDGGDEEPPPEAGADH